MKKSSDFRTMIDAMPHPFPLSRLDGRGGQGGEGYLRQMRRIERQQLRRVQIEPRELLRHRRVAQLAIDVEIRDLVHDDLLQLGEDLPLPLLVERVREVGDESVDLFAAEVPGVVPGR